MKIDLFRLCRMEPRDYVKNAIKVVLFFILKDNVEIGWFKKFLSSIFSQWLLQEGSFLMIYNNRWKSDWMKTLIATLRVII